MPKLNPLLPSSIQSFSEATISHHIGKPNRVGRSFTIHFTNEMGDKVTTTVKFKELVDQFRKLSRNADEESIKETYIKLKVANQNANHQLHKQSGWYQFRTSIHRLSNIFRKNHDTLLDRTLSKKSIDLPNTVAWYDDIIEDLPDYRSLTGFSRSLQVSKAAKIAQKHQKLAEKHPELDLMGANFSNGVSMVSFTMQGLSIIASYLKQKHNLENLYVCDSLEAFQEQLQQIDASPHDTRASFIIPLKGMGKNYHFVPAHQHKATICVEKKDGKLKIIYLDGEPTPVDESILHQSPNELKNLRSAGFSTPVFWCINQCQLNAELYMSTVKREYGSYGCETIALRDAVDFLNFPEFFEKIQCNEHPSIEGIAEVDFLPARFMKTTQSRKVLKEYIENNPDEVKEPIETARSGSRTLKKTHKHNTAKGYSKNGKLRKQNHYISFRSYKYHAMGLEAMKSMTTDELKAVIDDTYISANHPPMHGKPKNLHDLYTHFWNTP